MKISTKLQAFMLLPALGGLLASCATTIRTDLVQRHQSTDCVVAAAGGFLHGERGLPLVDDHDRGAGADGGKRGDTQVPADRRHDGSLCYAFLGRHPGSLRAKP
jgi:hypothetical protein